jgi:hypothetical protein
MPESNALAARQRRRGFVRRGSALAGLILATIAIFLLAGQAMALDVIKLKDGTTLQGEIVRETDRYVEFKHIVGNIEHTKFISRHDIKEIIRDATPPKQDETPRPERKVEPRKSPASEPAAPAESVNSNATRIAFISLGDPIRNDRDMVGTYINSGPLREIAKMYREMPEDERPEVIVLMINSGGGYTMEVPRLADTIHEDLKKDFRVVAWIRSAISAAAMTAWNCEEIVMMPEGHIGGATQFSGGGIASKGIELAQVLEMAESLSRRGRKPPIVMRAMQIPVDLSADIDADGNVIWHEGLKGQYILSTKEPPRVLTLNSVDAVKFDIAIGVANTKAELARVLSIPEWREVGQRGEELMERYRDNVWAHENEMNLTYRRYEQFISLANSARDRRTRGSYVNQAREQLSKLKGIIRRVPVVELLYGMDEEWFRQQERMLQDLMR